MLDEILYKEQLDQVKEYVKKNQYISLTKITEIFGSDTNDELLDDIVEYLDNAGVEITRDSEEVPSEEELMTEIVDDDFEAFVEDLETDDELDELATAVDSEIKVSDFEDIVSSGYSADDPVKMYLHDIGQIDLLTITQESEFARMYQESLMCQEKINSYKLKGWKIPPKKIIKRPDQIDGIRESGLVNIAVLDYVAENIHAGMSTEDIDRLVAEKTKELGGIAAPLNYEGFPKSVCTSINDAVCHGIPNEEEILQDGDIINVDVSTIYKGYFSDSSRMFCIGEVDDVSKKLVEDTLKAVQLGLSEVRPFNRLGNVGAVINEFAQSQGYKVVRDIGGHGVGLEFHEDPFVSYVTRRDTGMLLVPGMVFTIEPMINLGTDEIFIDSDNDWTVYTEDGAPSAQWEVTVAVTEDGYEILAY